METPQWTLMGGLKEEACTYFRSSLSDFYSLPGHRLMVYAVTFILLGLGVFTALSIYDHYNLLMDIPLKFMGMNAWHTAANLIFCLILVDVLSAYGAPAWGAYDRRTVGKVWIIFFAGYVLGFVSERTLAYKLIGLYEPIVIFLWEANPSQRAGVLPTFFFTLPFWIVITAMVMGIITRKQSQTEELLRVRIDAILEERNHLVDICPELAALAKDRKPLVSDDHLQLPMGSGAGPIRPSDICHVTAEDHYLRIYHQNGDGLQNNLVRLPMKELSTQLPEDRFIRIHRSHLVNLESILGLKRYGQSVRLSMKHGDFVLPVSRYRLPKLLPLLDRFLKN